MVEKYFTLQWHLTAECDQRCKHCYMYDEPTYASELRNALSTKAVFQVIDDFTATIKQWGLNGRINFTGGDPLLRFDFFEILKYASQKGLLLGILGNPFHINEATALELKELGVKKYQISIDGMEKTHDAIRRPGSFKESIRALRVLKKAGIQTDVMFSLTKANMNELQAVIDLVAREGIDQFAFARVAAVGSGKNFRELMPTPAEYRKFLLKTLKHYQQLEAQGVHTQFIRKDNLWQLLYDELELLPKLPLDNETIYGGCAVGIASLCILADGTVYACRRFPSPVGKVPDQKIKDIFLGEKLDFYRSTEKFKKCSNCNLLQICRGCPAVAYGISSDFYAADPQCWKKTS
ncbi:MAG: radical SAM protein [Candidatus Micrarchaeota archaeon]